MCLQQVTTRGIYIPAFYCIKMNEQVRCQASGRIILSSTLVHEFCHYIQDITTNFVLSNIAKTLSVLQDVASQAGVNASIDIPIKLDSIAAKYNASIIRRLWGYPKSKSKISVTDYELIPTTGTPKIDMYETIDINGDKTAFGTLGIIESMAVYNMQCLRIKEFLQNILTVYAKKSFR